MSNVGDIKVVLDDIIGKLEAKRSSFMSFAKFIMPTIEQTQFHSTYYRILDMFANGSIKKLIVSVPPQHGKSLASTQLLPAYILGLNPDTHIGVASYSATMASKFNRRIQRVITSEKYEMIFPDTKLRDNSHKPTNKYSQTSDVFDIVDRDGGLLSAGREGSITGNPIDVFIIDDLYKDAMEANSPLIRENCWEFYTSVVKTRLHNNSQELIVFTRWHEDDLIGRMEKVEDIIDLKKWDQLDNIPEGVWIKVNFEAIKQSEATEIDPRSEGEVLWPDRHSLLLLEGKRKLDLQKFEALYQGHPTSKEGLLYGDRFVTYDTLPEIIVKYANYTDTADMGDDHLCSMCYVVGKDGKVYVVDVLYTREPMEVTEPATGALLNRNKTAIAYIESNNGGRGFARAVQKIATRTKIEWFHQSGNKEARIISNSNTVLQNILMPSDWAVRWPDLHTHISTYRRMYQANRWHDAPDVLTGIIEREIVDRRVMIIR